MTNFLSPKSPKQNKEQNNNVNIENVISEEFAVNYMPSSYYQHSIHEIPTKTGIELENSKDDKNFSTMKRVVSTWWRQDEGSHRVESNSKSEPTKFKPNIFWQLLGFEKNPLISHEFIQNGKYIRNSSAADLRLSMLSNFSTSYNIVSISLALDMMGSIYDTLSVSDRSLCSSALLAGMILGQLGGGALGDFMGRHVAMTIVMFLQIIASVASAFSVDTEAVTLPWMFGSVPKLSLFFYLSVWRFILGLGCGGVYPLAATITAESSSVKENRGKLVALTFSMQGVGYLTVPFVAYILISTLGEKSDLAWRLLLGFGGLPGIILTYNRVSKHRKMQLKEPEIIGAARFVDRKVSSNQLSDHSIIDAMMTEENLFRKLCGTAGCWLLFDILFYGNALFQPVVLDAAFGNSETTLKTARDTLIIASLSLPGYFISIASIGKQSPRYIQMQGFLIMAVLYFIIGYWFYELAQMKMLLLILYGSTFFFSNYGPNATTFMLPSMTFSKACRSTLNGICAACGKAGALMGAIFFVPIANNMGNSMVMTICAILSLFSFVLTWCFVSDTVGMGVHDNDKSNILDESTREGSMWLGKNNQHGESSNGYSSTEDMITLESGTDHDEQLASNYYLQLKQVSTVSDIVDVKETDRLIGIKKSESNHSMSRIFSAPSLLDL